ncbi:tRNA pseudouridine(38-40) synthase TruA [Alicyclobacillus tolerans]|uniref:tRNA pseudouridine synthase A n=1 Tax=Alicyclobacillus tolerans TaxID=90970 RepID=A0ABT9LWA8_9BACL|nr:tRNA pseudouridine(38-40) synthase TruA [Alicyclobacillus tengchongensis]MDP9728532.1 tRNA pseudouridine38-40 synthase [Alicyclobacillus tengchongensis]
MRVKLLIAYDGTNFHGFARQNNLRTVQGELEACLSRVTASPVLIHGSGRTDAGVHARQQVVHWDQEHGPPVEKYPYVLRRILPPDLIAIQAEETTDQFHSRFSAIGKTYRYTFQTAAVADIFTHRFTCHSPGRLDLQKMREAACHLVGTHDFTSFCAASTPVEDKIRTIFDISVKESGSYVSLFVTGNGFLQNMVRIIAGTLLMVGQGKFTEQQVIKSIQACDRRTAGWTAPPSGLALWQVYYEESNLWLAVKQGFE